MGGNYFYASAAGANVFNPRLLDNGYTFQANVCNNVSSLTLSTNLGAGLDQIWYANQPTDSLTLGTRGNIYQITFAPGQSEATVWVREPSQYWACAIIYKIKIIRAVAPAIIEDSTKLVPPSCANHLDGSFATTFNGYITSNYGSPNTYSANVGIFSDQAHQVPLFRQPSLRYDWAKEQTRLSITGLPEGVYWLVVFNQGDCDTAFSRRLVIKAEPPILTLNCLGILPCASSDTSTIRIDGTLDWANGVNMLQQNRFFNYSYRVTFQDALGNVSAMAYASGTGARAAINARLPISRLAPQQPYPVLLEIFGDTCPDPSCDRYIPVCTANTHVSFEAPDLRLATRETLPQQDGKYLLQTCPLTADSIQVDMRWRPLQCNEPYTPQLSFKYIDGEGTPVSAPTGGKANLALGAITGSSGILTANLTQPRPTGLYDARYVRLVARLAGCADSIDVQIEPVNTSISITTDPVKCFNGTNPRRQVRVTLAQPHISTIYWNIYPGSSPLIGPPEMEVPSGSVYATVGRRECRTNTLTFSADTAMPDALTIDYVKRGTRVECAIEGYKVFSGLPTAGGPYRAIWVSERSIINRPRWPYGPGDIAVPAGIDTSRYLIESVGPTVWDDPITGTNNTFPQTGFLANPVEGRTYYLFLINNQTNCLSRSTNALRYRKPEASRQFNLVFEWGPAPSQRTPAQYLPEPRAGIGLAQRLAEEQAECRKRLVYLSERTLIAELTSPEHVRDTLMLSTRTPRPVRTLYLYDRAGRLSGTVPPEGNTILTAQSKFTHSLQTRYGYDVQGRRLLEQNPNAGSTYMVYDAADRMRFSQTEQDRAEGKYRFTTYDPQSRIRSTGRVAGAVPASQNLIDNPAYASVAGAIIEESITHQYDDADGLYGGSAPYWLRHSRGRLVASDRLQPAPRGTAPVVVRTLNGYSPEGNVERVAQILPGTDTLWTSYAFEAASERVTSIAAHAGRRHLLTQGYTYDSDGRIVEVRSSQDSVAWQTDARYYYYPHGPLRRLELGEEKVQGVDYAYTLEGWLKGINSTLADTLTDMGGDGKRNSAFSQDAFAMRLDYFTGDYNPANPTGHGLTAYSARQNLYDGNISAWAATTPALRGNKGGATLAQAYRYDALSRIVSARPTGAAGTALGNGLKPLAFASAYRYDLQGNLKKLVRHTGSGAELDSINYAYNLAGGRLQNDLLPSVSDGSILAPDSGGLAQGAHAFSYDRDGRLTEDARAQSQTTWTLDSKPRRVVTGTGTTQKQTHYLYDAQGQRAAQVRLAASATVDTTELTLREASGKELAHLEQAALPDTLRPLTFALYGTQRLGERLYQPARQAYSRPRGQTRYELTDHLGNVHVVVSDAKRDTAVNGALVLSSRVLSAQDYYPFGMRVPERTVQWAGGRYRWGYNGKELDGLLAGTSAEGRYDYGFRVYDAALARFSSVDPLREKYPYYTQYQYAGNMPIRFIDLDGLEPGAPPTDYLWNSWSETSGHPLPNNINTREGAKRYGRELAIVAGKAAAMVALAVAPIEEIVFGGIGLGLKYAGTLVKTEKAIVTEVNAVKLIEGGRLGNSKTRQQIREIASEMKNRGWNITDGGGDLKEEYIKPIIKGRKGGSYPDITAEKNGTTLRVQTVDMRKNGTMTKREQANADRIRQQKPNDKLLIIPKNTK